MQRVRTAELYPCLQLDITLGKRSGVDVDGMYVDGIYVDGMACADAPKWYGTIPTTYIRQTKPATQSNVLLLFLKV